MKICLIGAGSTIFAKNLIGDFFLHEEIENPTIVLHDIDAERLKTSTLVGERIREQTGQAGEIISTLDRREAIAGASYVILMMQIGGYQPGTVRDFEIPKKYGLRQTIADTLGIGGIMRTQRTLPVVLDICKEVEELAPNAIILNYVNPMSMLVWGAARVYPNVKMLGLCHSVQLTIKELAEDLKMEAQDIEYFCAGINHMAFYLTLKKGLGKSYATASVAGATMGSSATSAKVSAMGDLYPELRRVAAEGKFPQTNKVRYEIFKNFGYFVTESSEHFSEYVPWFIKRGREDLIEEFNIPLDEYITRCEKQIKDWHALKTQLEDRKTPLEVKLSDEYAARIIAALEGGTEARINANLPNATNGGHLITNLPLECCVEVPCYLSASGIAPVQIGKLPPALAALMRTNINVQELAVEAVLTRDRQTLYQAALLDPHTGGELSIAEIRSLVDDLLTAHSDFLPAYH